MVSVAVLIHTSNYGILAGKGGTTLILDVTPLKDITWGCIWSVLCMTLTIIFNNPVYLVLYTKIQPHLR